MRHGQSQNSAATPSAVLGFIGAVVLGVLSFFEHNRSIRPSFILNIYLLLTVPSDIVRSRSYSLVPSLDAIATAFSTRIGVKLILAILEALPKTRLLLPECSDVPPESTSGPYKRALFWWVNSLLKKGYSNTLTVDDLFDLDKHLQSDYLHHVLGSAWAKGRFHPYSHRLQVY